jgi:hypothetical protein
MVEAQVLERKREGRMSFFSLVNPSEAKQLLVSYKSSFLDEAVDSFVNVVQELSVASDESIADAAEKEEPASD